MLRYAVLPMSSAVAIAAADAPEAATGFLAAAPAIDGTASTAVFTSTAAVALAAAPVPAPVPAAAALSAAAPAHGTRS
ncbi:hypothetical protein [Streptomyces sp. WZ-12]|uniref:hypothetical protein n=1 Tax=Streptomyces sp. WZ-12 TaxID=3030210 RepID=UPI0023811546|nr:hypothetical protein [Streptomyces sp. WZ-12]